VKTDAKVDMQRLTKNLGLALSLLIVLSWASLQTSEVLSLSAPFLQMRKALTSLTGALALGWMGFTMLLALRPAWLEQSLGGLDKLYKTHKWAGITAVLLVVAHWLLILSPRTLVSWGWIEPMQRRLHGHGGGASLVGLAKELGEWSAWIMIVLGIVALLRSIPYDWFRKLHKGFPVAMLIGAFHAIVMLSAEELASPFGFLVVAVSLLGAVVAVLSLLNAVGRSRRYAGTVAKATVNAAGILDLEVTPGAGWPGHVAGQFALLTIDSKEGAHPFTIASDWKRGARLRFAIKPLGDYTRTLPGRVRAGDRVLIEGPYGRFDFGDRAERQVWVAGGIGVAPFVARLEALAAAGGAQGKIHFFYSARTTREASFPAGLEDLCRRAGVELHLRTDDYDGQIEPEEIGGFARDADGVWFCGPSGWAVTLQDVLQRSFGVPPGRFHREIFEFR
jgi:predicted ferric reductase